MPQSIAIIGAGPAGLTLARLLLAASSIPADALCITVFEKDASRTARISAGGTLDLHPKTGLAAIRKAGLWDAFHKHARYEGEEMSFADKNDMVYLHFTETPKVGDVYARPEIDREKLQTILLDSVMDYEADGKVQTKWGKWLRNVDRQGLLHFADGSQEGPFDLVVGAEGAWSKIRNVFSAEKPAYAGVCGFQGSISKDVAGPRWEGLSQHVGQGSYFTYSEGQSLMAQRMGDGSIKTGIWLKDAEDWPSRQLELSGDDEHVLRAIILARFPTWHHNLRMWIECSTQFRAWPLYELPVGHYWEHKAGYTLLGDAAHLMTPFAGEGVNAAMRDSLDLAEAIEDALSSGDSTLDEAVQAYEKSMYPRARDVQQMTMRNKEAAFFREDAPVGLLVGFLDDVARETGYSLDRGLLGWLPVRKLAYAWFWSVSTFGWVRRSLRG